MEGDSHMTPEEMFANLTDENKKEINLLIETYIASQSFDQQASDSPD